MSERVIWKFSLPSPNLEGLVSISMPKGARLLTVQVQRKEPCLWALVDPRAEKEERRFHVFGTGHPHPESTFAALRFVGTFQIEDTLVFHVFVEPIPSEHDGW